MIDKIVTSLSSTDVDATLQKYAGSIEITSLNDYTNNHSFNIKNMRVVISISKKTAIKEISIMGSLNKFIHGYNIRSCTRLEIEKAIKKLSGLLMLPIENADVNSIEVGKTFVMQHEPSLYHLKLSEIRRYKKSMIKNYDTIYFEVNKRLLTFYDKKKEAPSEKILSDLISNNLLRYEFKLKSRESISKQLGIKDLKIKDLYNKGFYNILLNKYKEEYFKVITNPNPILTTKPSVRLLADFLSMHGINDLGGVNETIVMIHKLCKQYNIPKQRLIDKVHNIANKMELLGTDDLIEELSRKVKRSVEFML